MNNYEDNYELEKQLRELRSNLPLFARTFFPTATKQSTPQFHHEIARNLLDPNVDRLLVAAPRSTAKSTQVCFFYPMHRIAFKPTSEQLFIMIISESQEQAINHINRIKWYLENSVEFRQMFGDYGPNTAKKWTNDDIILKDGTRIVARGTGQKIRGNIQVDTRPSLILVDDFESEHNAGTQEARAANRRWMTDAVVPSLDDNGKIVVVGTVVSEDCFLYWCKTATTWKVLWYKIIQDDGTLLWPSKFPLDRIEKIKLGYEQLGQPNGFYQEYMNEAQSPAERAFKPEYMQQHHYDFVIKEGKHYLSHSVGEKQELIRVNVYAGVDPASSLSNRADYFAIAVVAIDHNFNVYLVGKLHTRIDPSLQAEKIIEFYLRYKPMRMKIETTGYQETLRSYTRKLMTEKKLYIPGLESGVKPRTSKSERLLSLQPLFAKRKFFFRPEDIEVQSEFLAFPKGKHDDMMDAIWDALDGAKAPHEEKIEIKKDRKKREVIDWMTL